jgi:hypothetical protein
MPRLINPKERAIGTDLLRGWVSLSTYGSIGEVKHTLPVPGVEPPIVQPTKPIELIRLPIMTNHLIFIYINFRIFKADQVIEYREVNF